MKENPQKPVIGLLGGIASGKSTVASTFQALGCAIVNADNLAHKALTQSTIRDNVIKAFGPDIQETDGSINRTTLGQVVFQNPDKLNALNHLLHPWILEKCQEELANYQKNPTTPAIVLDMPLLLEVKWDAICHHIVFVECDEKIRIKRASNRGISPKNLEEREKFQISLDKKAQRADNIVINNSDLSSLVRQVTRIFTSIINK